MGFWSDVFSTSDPETGEKTSAAVKTDSSGAVTDFIYGLEKDADGGHHGHAWNLGPETDDESIGGRDPADSR